MIYRTLGKNETGQVVVACPHLSTYLTCDMHEMPSGATLFRLFLGQQGVYMLPSKRTIAMWCQDCYLSLEAPPVPVSSESVANRREVQA